MFRMAWVLGLRTATSARRLCQAAPGVRCAGFVQGGRATIALPRGVRAGVACLTRSGAVCSHHAHTLLQARQYGSSGHAHHLCCSPTLPGGSPHPPAGHPCRPLAPRRGDFSTGRSYCARATCWWRRRERAAARPGVPQETPQPPQLFLLLGRLTIAVEGLWAEVRQLRAELRQMPQHTPQTRGPRDASFLRQCHSQRHS